MTGDVTRDRLSRISANNSQLNVSLKQNTSAFEDKLSPVCKSRHKNDNERLEKLRTVSLLFKIKCHIFLLMFIIIDYLVFNSAIFNFFFFFNSLPDSIMVPIFICLSAYLFAVAILLAVEIKFPKASTEVSKKLESFYQSKSTVDTPARNLNASAVENKSARVNDSMCASSAEHSWVDAHKFGASPARNLTKNSSFRASPYRRKSPNSSRILNVGASDSSPHLDNSTSTNWRSPTSYSKPIESIHTRKQLDVLLRSHENESPVDVNTTQNTYFSSIWNIFDFGRNGKVLHNNSYQLSEEADYENEANSAYKMKIGKNGRTEVRMLRKGERANDNDGEGEEDEMARLQKVMHAARSAAEAKVGILKRTSSVERSMRGRRRSHSSPERNTDFYANEADSRYRICTMLTEEQQKRAEFRVRAWVRNTIILPLAEEIDAINKVLEKEHASPSLRIGVSTIDALKLAAIERNALKSTNLPFVLPFLAVHTNQAYLVSRVKELSSSEFMDVYKWNSGGMEPTEDKLQSSRIVRREWNDSLPTDAVLLFDLFSVYMDAQLNSNCLVGDNRLDQPFSSRYAVKYPKKPVAFQRSAYSFYLHMASLSPPHVEFVHTDGNGSIVKSLVARQTSNLFRAIAQFVHHVKEDNHGYLDQTSIGSTGINIACVLH